MRETRDKTNNTSRHVVTAGRVTARGVVLHQTGMSSITGAVESARTHESLSSDLTLWVGTHRIPVTFDDGTAGWRALNVYVVESVGDAGVHNGEQGYIPLPGEHHDGMRTDIQPGKKATDRWRTVHKNTHLHHMRNTGVSLSTLLRGGEDATDMFFYIGATRLGLDDAALDTIMAGPDLRDYDEDVWQRDDAWKAHCASMHSILTVFMEHYGDWPAFSYKRELIKTLPFAIGSCVQASYDDQLDMMLRCWPRNAFARAMLDMVDHLASSERIRVGVAGNLAANYSDVDELRKAVTAVMGEGGATDDRRSERRWERE